jgi:hypothetical protein
MPFVLTLLTSVGVMLLGICRLRRYWALNLKRRQRAASPISSSGSPLSPQPPLVSGCQPGCYFG